MSSSMSATPTEPIPAKSMLIKTDKPRPYVCTTCTRSFARLEHLKRHERSHTKEKPFSCPVCERSFARRDLLLRHKQKLHASFSPDKPASADEASGTSPATASSSACSTKPRTPATMPGGKRRRAASIKKEPSKPIPTGAAAFPTLPKHIYASSPTPQTTGQVPVSSGPNQINGHASTNTNGSVPAVNGTYDMGMHNNNNQPNRGWLPLNPLEHELENLRSMVPPQYRAVNTRPSRANSFSAASATSYIKQKDFANAESAALNGPSEVGFATPQAYAVDIADDMPEFLDLDLSAVTGNGFVNPQQLMSEPAPLAPSQQQPQPGVHSQLPTRVSPRERLQSMTGRRTSTQDFLIGDQAVDSPSYMAPHPADQYWNSPMPFPGSVGTVPAPTPDSLVEPSTLHLAEPSAMSMRADSLFKEYLDDQTDEFMSSLVNLGTEDHPVAQVQHVPKGNDWMFATDTTAFSSTPEFSSSGSSSGSTNDFDLSVTSGAAHVPGTGPGHLPGQLPGQPSSQLAGQVAGQSPAGIPMGGGVYSRSPRPVRTAMSPATATKLFAASSISPEHFRYISAYFAVSAAHLPFVHVTAPAQYPEMQDALAAFGAQVSGDVAAAQRLYVRAKQANESMPKTLQSLQAGLLVAIFGIFHGDLAENQAALERLRTLCGMAGILGLHHPMNDADRSFADAGFNPYDGSGIGNMVGHNGGLVDGVNGVERHWRQYILAETRIRTLHALNAVSTWVCVLTRDGFGMDGASGLGLEACGSPSEENVWAATSANDWYVLHRSATPSRRQTPDGAVAGHISPNPPPSARPPSFGKCMAQLWIGRPVTEPMPQLQLQSLLLRLLSRSISRKAPVPEPKALKAWESTWSCSPMASLDPNSLYGPIMPGCVPLVSLSAVREVVELGTVADAMWNRDFVLMNHELDFVNHTNRVGIVKAAPYALDVLAWTEKHATASTIYFPTVIALAQCSLVLSGALYGMDRAAPATKGEHELLQRTGKLIARVLRVDEASVTSLSRGSLQAAQALMSLSNWPLAGVFRDALEQRISHISGI